LQQYDAVAVPVISLPCTIALVCSSLTAAFEPKYEPEIHASFADVWLHFLYSDTVACVQCCVVVAGAPSTALPHIVLPCTVFLTVAVDVSA
jgi:hypothetical protein